MFKGVLALTATAAISLAVFANSASAEDLTKFYSTERVSGYKSGEFMILAEDNVNFRSNPAVSNNIISCLPRHSLLRITKDEQPWAEAVWNGHKGYIATEYLTPAEAEPLLNDEDINKHTITAMEGKSPLFATMRGVSNGDEAARVVGQYGMPNRVVYFTPDKNDESLKQTMMLGYDFPSDGDYEDAGLDFYIDSNDRVSKIVLRKDD